MYMVYSLCLLAHGKALKDVHFFLTQSQATKQDAFSTCNGFLHSWRAAEEDFRSLRISPAALLLAQCAHGILEGGLIDVSRLDQSLGGRRHVGVRLGYAVGYL